jgi:hypothetical protein
VSAQFDWQGTLTTVIVEKVSPNAQQQCDAGAEGTGGTCSTNAAGELQLT